MKILSVEVAGFGPFRTRQVVDFTRFDDDGLFLIAGPTGAGKSSVLDAITFALYGRAPRYESAGIGERVRSNFCEPGEPTEVTVEFEHGGGRYRMRRSPDYQVPKKSGDGFKTVAAKLAFERREGDEWHTLATKAREVAAEFEKVFPLSATEFLQVVLLAQNSFMKFLAASTSERQAVLRKLFATDLYADLTKAVTERANAAQTKVQEVTGTIAGAVDQIDRLRDTVARSASELIADEPAADTTSAVDVRDAEPAADAALADTADVAVSPDSPRRQAELALSVIREWQSRVTEALAEAQATADRDDRLARSAKDQRSLQRQRQALRSEQEQLQLRTQELNDHVLPRIATAEAAAPLVAYAEALERAENEAELRGKAEQRAQTELASLPADEGTALSLASCDAESITQARELLGALRNRETIERDFAQRQQDEQRALDRQEALVRTVERLQQAAAERPGKLAEQRLRHDDLQAQALLVEPRREAVERARQTLDAAKQLAVAEAQHIRAVSKYDEALALREQADQLERSLFDLRYRTAAIELATQLEPGSPCPVCGASEHPHPAEPTEQHRVVSDVELAEAQAGSQAARDRAVAASKALAESEGTRERLRTAAGGLTAEAAQAALAAANRELTAAEAASKELTASTALIAKLEQEIELDAQQLREAETELTTARATHAAAAAATVELRDEVMRLRGKWASVDERIQRVTALTTAAESLLAARNAAKTAAERVQSAREELDARLAGSPFGDRAALVAASLASDQLEALREQVATVRESSARVAGQLADERFADLPEEAVDVDTPAEAAHRSRQRATKLERLAGAIDADRGRADDYHRTITELTDRIGDLAERAETMLRFADTLRGQNAFQQNLEVFVLASWLSEIIGAANGHLVGLSAGRYTLEVDESLESYGRQSGLGIAVFDSYNGELRTPQSLSGGETFLVSLALALGLAEVVSAQAGGISLDTLFIDEGFGSLDSETLEVAMRTLDRLHQSGRTIGVISHVEAMHQRIPAKLQVSRKPDGSSELRVASNG